MAGHVACERRGTFCTVESERSGGGLSGRDAVKSLSAKFGGITIESTKMWVLAPAPAELGPSVVGGGVTRPAWLSRGGFRPLQKVSANPYFNHTTFPPLFAFSALGVQGRAEGARVDSDGSGASLGVCVTVSVPLQKVSANPYFIHTTFPPLISLHSRRSVAVLGLGEDGSSDTERSKAGRQWPSRGGAEGRAPKYPTNPPLRF